MYYNGKSFGLLSGGGFKSNYFDEETGDHYWISGCKKRGGDRLYPGWIDVDPDVRVEYWTAIRGKPERANEIRIRCLGKYRIS